MSKTNKQERKRRPKLYVPPSSVRQDYREELEEEIAEWEEQRQTDISTLNEEEQ